MNPSAKIRYFPIKISLFYCLIASVWFLAFDGIPAKLAYDTLLLREIKILKFIGFLFISTLFVYLFCKHFVTEMRNTEQTLKNELELMHTLMDTIPNPVFYKDLEGRYQGCNEALAHQVYNLPKEEIIGRTVFDFPNWISSDKARYHHEQDMKVAQGKDIQLYEFPVLCVDGQFHKFFFNKKCFHDAQGNPAGIVCIMTDITRFEMYDAEIRESKKRYRAIVEDTPAMICRFLPDGSLTFANSCFCEYFHQKKEALIGANFFDFLAKKDVRKVKRQFAALDSVRPTAAYTVRSYAPDGSIRWQRRIDRGLFDDNGQILEYQSLGFDITEEKNTQDEKTKLEQQLQQAQKMEAIGTLASGIAHDFNNILSAIMGYAEIIMMNMDSASSDYPLLSQVLNSADRAKGLIRQILTFSRQSNQEMQPIRIAPIIKEVLKLIRAGLPSTIDIHQAVQCDCLVMADPTQIHQVVMNLCTNAGHAMKESGGVLEVHTGHETLQPDDRPEFQDLKPGTYLKLSVKDTGYGISPLIIDRIFEPFFTTKTINDGTGLGLSVVHGIVKSHGGAISVSSQPRLGTQFDIFLPEIQEKNHLERSDDHSLPTGNEHVLLIDDEQPIIEIGELMLTSLGYEVTSQTDSMEAVELYQSNPEAFDLIITDLTMPQMTGTELSRQLHQINPKTPIILCTGFSWKIDEAKMAEIGIRAIIHKPALKEEFAHTIRRVLD